MMALAIAAQQPPGLGEMLDRWYWILLLIGAFLGAWVAIKKIREPEEAKRRILPHPIVTEQVKVYVEDNTFKEELGKVRREFNEKFDGHSKYVHESIHGLRNELNKIEISATEGREVATEQFQKIEGRLGELKATSEHTNALAIRTDQAVRALSAELPKQIADAVRKR